MFPSQLAVISGVGVRKYYERFGYRMRKDYQVRAFSVRDNGRDYSWQELTLAIPTFRSFSLHGGFTRGCRRLDDPSHGLLDEIVGTCLSISSVASTKRKCAERCHDCATQFLGSCLGLCALVFRAHDVRR